MTINKRVTQRCRGPCLPLAATMLLKSFKIDVRLETRSEDNDPGRPRLEPKVRQQRPSLVPSRFCNKFLRSKNAWYKSSSEKISVHQNMSYHRFFLISIESLYCSPYNNIPPTSK